MSIVMWSDLMMRPQPNGYFLIIAFALIGIFFFPFKARSTDDKTRQSADPKMQLIYSLKGADLFRVYCASCHGREGRGDGPVAAALNSKVPDLTTIENRRGGIFPEKWLRELIGGDQSVLAHGTREMPIWGPIFHQIENDHDYGEVRMQNLIGYLRSIQQK